MSGSPHPQPLSRLRARGAARVAGATSLLARVDAFLHHHLPPDARLCLGFSGGLDSTVLLHCLVALRARRELRLSACHVHHGLSKQADDWEQHCRTLAAEWQVPIEVHKVTVTPAGEGLEAAARAARYAVFETLPVEAVALAQHRDDQAETVLLQLLRGADLHALAAMPAERDLAGRKLLRPLLDVARAELEDYARQHGLRWVEDESNQHLTLSRNAIRQRVLPALLDYFPQAQVELARAARGFAESADLLDQLARLDAGEASIASSLPVARLAGLSTPRALNMLRHFVLAAGGQVRRGMLQEALRQILTAQANACLEVRCAEHRLVRFRERVWLVAAELPAMAEQIWSGESRLDLPGLGTLEFRPEAGGVRLIPGQTRLSPRLGGERLRLAANRPRRALKDWLREAGVAPWRREGLPLLYVGGELAWVAELGAEVAFQAGPDEPGWLISWTWAQSAGR